MDPTPSDSTPTPPAPSPPIQLTFDIEEPDLIAWFHFASEHDRSYKRTIDHVRRQYQISLAIALVLSATFVVGMITDTLGATLDRPLGLILLAGSSTGAWWAWDQYRRTRSAYAAHNHAKRYMLTDGARGSLGPRLVTLSPEAITLRSQNTDITQRWSGISEVSETPDLILLVHLGRHAYIIPKRIFASPAEAQAIADKCRQWLDAAGDGDAGRLRTFLAHRDAPCPRCRYNLRGVTQGKCPECGLMLDLVMMGAGR